MEEISYWQNILLFLLTVLLLMSIDLLWVTRVAGEKYSKDYKRFLPKKIKNYRVILFYSVFSIGLIVMAIEPAINNNSLGIAMFRGLAFGFLTYSMHGLMNWIAIDKWPKKATINIVMWGTILSWSVATLTYNIYTAI